MATASTLSTPASIRTGQERDSALPLARSLRVLVTYASKHGSTQEIAARIAAHLEQRGVKADLRRAKDVDQLDGYDGVVIGSAVYIGRWMKEATEFVERVRPALAGSRVWLFSSGPLGDQPGVDPPQIVELEASLNAVDHRLFAGSMSKDRLSLVERALVKGVKAPYGDFRDWEAIDFWAAAIAKELDSSRTAQPAAPGTRGE